MVEKILNKLFNRRDIVNCDKDVYLRRWYTIRTKPFAIFIHKFERSDEDRFLHCHPFSFIVLPIWRGYNEYSCAEPDKVKQGVSHTKERCRRVLPFLGLRYRNGTYRHRVELIDGKPAWSIFFRFKKFRDWGFWTKTGFVQWNEWWKQNCE